MPLDAVMLTALRRELEEELSCAKIDRIGMPAPIIDAIWRVKGTISVFASFFAPLILGAFAI